MPSSKVLFVDETKREIVRVTIKEPRIINRLHLAWWFILYGKIEVDSKEFVDKNGVE